MRKKVRGEKTSTAHQLARDSSLEGRDKAILAQSNHASITMLIGHLGKVPIINGQLQRQQFKARQWEAVEQRSPLV